MILEILAFLLLLAGLFFPGLYIYLLIDKGNCSSWYIDNNTTNDDCQISKKFKITTITLLIVSVVLNILMNGFNLFDRVARRFRVRPAQGAYINGTYSVVNVVLFIIVLLLFLFSLLSDKFSLSSIKYKKSDKNTSTTLPTNTSTTIPSRTTRVIKRSRVPVTTVKPVECWYDQKIENGKCITSGGYKLLYFIIFGITSFMLYKSFDRVIKDNEYAKSITEFEYPWFKYRIGILVIMSISTLWTYGLSSVPSFEWNHFFQVPPDEDAILGKTWVRFFYFAFYILIYYSSTNLIKEWKSPINRQI